MPKGLFDSIYTCREGEVHTTGRSYWINGKPKSILKKMTGRVVRGAKRNQKATVRDVLVLQWSIQHVAARCV